VAGAQRKCHEALTRLATASGAAKKNLFVMPAGGTVPDTYHSPVTLEDLEGRDFAYPYEAAMVLRIDVRTLRSAIAAGEIPAVRTGQQFRVPVAWLRQKALAGQTAGSP
jgi:excisionase family DNA binding protein